MSQRCCAATTASFSGGPNSAAIKTRIQIAREKDLSDERQQQAHSEREALDLKVIYDLKSISSASAKDVAEAS